MKFEGVQCRFDHFRQAFLLFLVFKLVRFLVLGVYLTGTFIFGWTVWYVYRGENRSFNFQVYLSVLCRCSSRKKSLVDIAGGLMKCVKSEILSTAIPLP